MVSANENNKAKINAISTLPDLVAELSLCTMWHMTCCMWQAIDVFAQSCPFVPWGTWHVARDKQSMCLRRAVPLYRGAHDMLHVTSNRCVCTWWCPGHFEHTCWKQFLAQWWDCNYLELRLSVELLLLLLFEIVTTLNCAFQCNYCYFSRATNEKYNSLCIGRML